MENFEEIKVKGEEFYKNIGDIYCPYFKEKISFGMQGLEHLKFKGRERARADKDQYMRFKLIYLAPEILQCSGTVQGKLQAKKFERIRVHSRTDTVLKLVTYHEFIALMKRDRVKIIVKQIESGEKFFWSIIPFWGMNDETKSRIFHEGEPEED